MRSARTTTINLEQHLGSMFGKVSKEKVVDNVRSAVQGLDL